MLAIGILKKVRNGYSGSRNNPFSPQPVFAFLENNLKNYSDESSDEMPVGLKYYLGLLNLWRGNRNDFKPFKGLHAEFDATIALFELLPELPLLETTASGHGYAELHRLFNWIEDESISAVKLNRLLMRMHAAEILTKDNLRHIMETRAWSIRENVAATKTPVSFKHIYKAVKSDINNSSKIMQVPIEEKQNFIQQSFSNLFVNDGNRLDFRTPGW